LIIVDLLTGRTAYFQQGRQILDNELAPPLRAQTLPNLNATIDYATGNLQIGNPQMQGRKIRVFYKVHENWAISVQKAANRYYLVQDRAAMTYDTCWYDLGAVFDRELTESARRLYFTRSEAGKTILLREYWYDVDDDPDNGNTQRGTNGVFRISEVPEDRAGLHRPARCASERCALGSQRYGASCARRAGAVGQSARDARTAWQTHTHRLRYLVARQGLMRELERCRLSPIMEAEGMRFRQAYRERQAGFTLVELLVVIAITAILLGLLLIPLVQGFRLTRQGQIQAQAQDTVRLALNQFTNDLKRAAYVFDSADRVISLPVRNEQGQVVNVPLRYAVIDMVMPAYGDPSQESNDPTSDIPSIPTAPTTPRLLCRFRPGARWCATLSG
jgi:prepilin-type N-terminal cleavage/methylation domain-containing protein